MTLPFDYARCAGTTHAACQQCRRTEPGREQRQSYVFPAIDPLTGQCGNFISPGQTRPSGNVSERRNA